LRLQAKGESPPYRTDVSLEFFNISYSGIGLLRILEEAPGLQAGIKISFVVLIGILGSGMFMMRIISEKYGILFYTQNLLSASRKRD